MADVVLDEKVVEGLFAEAKHQSDWLLGLYKMVIPDWDNVVTVGGFPKVNKWTANHLCQMAIDFDKKNHPGVLPGGIWLNNGFSVDEDGNLADWEVSLDGCNVEYK